MWNSLKSVKHSSSADLSPALEAAKSRLPSSLSGTLAMRAMRSAMAMSRFVHVGDLNMTVSDKMALAISPAMFGDGMTPCS